MAKFIKLFFLVIFFFLVIPVKAFEFIKSENNPLTINYDFDYSYMLQANIFKKDDQYAGILTAKRPQENYSLLLIESSDGINWSVTKEILNLGFEISNARLLSISGYGKLFLTKTETNGLYKIYSTDCDTSFNCSPNLSLVLEPDINDTTEKNGFTEFGELMVLKFAWRIPTTGKPGKNVRINEISSREAMDLLSIKIMKTFFFFITAQTATG